MWGFIRENTLCDFLQLLGGNDKIRFKNVRKNFILYTFEFLLIVCDFSSCSGFIKKDHKIVVTGYHSDRQVCGITTSRAKTPITEEGTFEQCKEFFQEPIREKFPFQANIVEPV